jgi:hypothetical protein
MLGAQRGIDGVEFYLNWMSVAKILNYTMEGISFTSDKYDQSLSI